MGLTDGEKTGIEKRWQLFETSPTIVEERINDMKETSMAAYGTVMEAIQSLITILKQLTLIDKTIPIDTTVINVDEISGDPPVVDESKFDYKYPDMPPDPIIVDATLGVLPPFPDLVVGDVESMVRPDEPPVVDASMGTLPEFPDLVVGDVESMVRPEEPQVVDASMGTLPEFPDLVVGDVESFTLPADPQVVDATVGTFPDYPELVVGDLQPPNEIYVSSLLTAIKAKLLDDLQNGSIGIYPAVEDAIFYREYERSILEQKDLEDGIAGEWSSRGWPLPNGALLAGINQAKINFTNKRLDMSREVAIKSFELALQNYHFIIEKGIGFESHLIDYAHSVATLAFNYADAAIKNTLAGFRERREVVSAKIASILDNAKIKIQYNASLIELFSAKVRANFYEVEASRFKVDAQIAGFNARTQGVSEQTRAVVETAKSKVEYNKMLVDLLNGRTNTARSLVEASRSKVDAQISAFSERTKGVSEQTRAVVDTAKSKVENNRMLIDLFNARANVSRSIVEASKFIVDAQIAGFNARTQGVSEETRAIIEKAKAEIQYNLQMIQLFSEKIKAFSAKIEGEGVRVNAAARGYEVETSVFKATTDFDIQKVVLNLKVLEAKMTQAIQNGNLLIKDKEIEMKNYEALNSLMVEAQKAIGAIAAQLVAGVYAGISVGASISASNTANYQAKSGELILTGAL